MPQPRQPEKKPSHPQKTVTADTTESGFQKKTTKQGASRSSSKNTARTKTTRKAPAAKKQGCLKRLLDFDADIRAELSENCHLIGLDEVGRGSLIGPVTAGAVCFHTPPDAGQRKLLKWLNDSKQVQPEARAELAAAIHEIAWVGIGEAEKDEVDRLNIHYASLLAVHRAFQALCDQAGIQRDEDHIFLLLDGRSLIPDYSPRCQKAVVKGDGKSASIAAASIVAKEHRDGNIRRLALEYPGYEWETNMGYNTPGHQRGMEALGLTPLHRKNFRAVIDQMALELVYE